MSKGKACPEEIARHIHPSMGPVSRCSLTGWQGMAPDGQHKNACSKYKSSKMSSRSVWYMVAPLSPMKIIGLMFCAAYFLNMAVLAQLAGQEAEQAHPWVNKWTNPFKDSIHLAGHLHPKGNGQTYMTVHS
jgi:hypothetical protein